jgi:hypothetical protein
VGGAAVVHRPDLCRAAAGQARTAAMEIMMPSVSKKQHNAMAAAAFGKSTLGIPKKVGKDFVKADKGKKFRNAGRKSK